MTTYNMFLYLIKHGNNRFYDQRLDKYALDTMGTILVEKFKCIK